MNIHRDTAIDDLYLATVQKEFQDEKDAHVPSGKLSASMLAKPLLWQILKTIGVPQREIDVYVQLTFDRGKQVEDLFLDRMPVTDRQKPVEYRNTVGKLDAMITLNDDTTPLEVKSVKYSKWKRIASADEPDEQYILQATLYGLALKTKNIRISVIDTQSGNPLTFKYPTNYLGRKVEGIIDAYETAMKRRFMPVFEPLYQWQAKPEYSDYPEFTGLSESEIIDKLKEEFPECYQKWKTV